MTPTHPDAATWGRLRSFLAVHESGSVSSAAERLHVTPSAVSTAVSALETALGTRLFSKHGRGVRSTEAGDTFAGYARSLLGLLEEATGAVGRADRGRLRIGAVATASEYLLPGLMAGFVSRHPLMELSLSVLPRDELFAGAVHHEVDVVLAGRPPSESGLRTHARRPNRLAVVGRPGLDARASRWLLTGEGSGTRTTTLSLLSELEMSPSLLTLGTSGAVIAAARVGLGLTVAHEEAVRDLLDSGALTTYPLPGTPLERPWHLCTGPSPSEATTLFLSYACSADLAGDAAFTPEIPRRGEDR